MRGCPHWQAAPGSRYHLMIQACLFDIGNVLVSFDYSRAFHRIAGQTQRTLEDLKSHLSEAGTALETGSIDSGTFISEALAFLGEGVSRESFLSAFTEIFALNRPMWEVVDAVRAVMPVHLFSNTSEIHETWLFQKWPEFSRFNGGFFSWRLGSMKPGAGMYERAIQTLGVPPESIAYIDDLPANIETGRRFGFRSHLYDLRRHEALLDFLDACGVPHARA